MGMPHASTQHYTCITKIVILILKLVRIVEAVLLGSERMFMGVPTKVQGTILPGGVPVL